MRLLFKILKKLFGLNRFRVIRVHDINGNTYYKVQRKQLTTSPKAKTIWEWIDEPDPLMNNATHFNNPEQAFQWFQRLKRFPKKQKIKVLDEF